MSEDQNMSNENQEMQIEQDGDRANGDNMDNEDERKLFVGGLNWETTENDLRDYMSRFGKVSSCNLKRDLDSGRSRGFGFVVFEDKETVAKVLEQSEHKLQGNKIDPKRANPKGKNQEQPVKKIYVAKVSPSTTEQQIKDYFEQWGKVDKIEAPFDKEKDQRKNFVFVEFEDEETVNTILKLTVDNPDYTHKLVNDEIEIKKATPNRARGRGGFFRGGDRGGPRGRGYGGGYGGWNSNYNQGYGYDGYGGYNYGNGYGGGNYNYNNYDYNYGYGGGWGGYDQSGYYGGYGGYDYGSGWGGYGDQSGQHQGNYGKAPKGGRGGGYRPY